MTWDSYRYRSPARTAIRGLQPAYESGTTLVTGNLPFQEWTEVLGSERLTIPDLLPTPPVHFYSACSLLLLALDNRRR